VDPIDGFVCHAWTYNDWVALQRQHLHANERKEPIDLEETMQDQLCQTLPPGWCNFDDANRPRAHGSLDWSAVAGALKTFAAWMVQGCQHVHQEEANRRALICSRCYLNVSISGCSGCQALVKEVLHTGTTKYDFALRGCGVCKCVLRAKVHFPQEILDRENARVQDQYPSFCWNKFLGENYRP